MKFSCPNCTAKYQIADEKVAGRTVKMKCRKCGTVIPIVAQPSRRSLERAPEVHALSLKPQPHRPGPPTVPAQPAQWHAGVAGSAKGPLSEKELRALFDEGSVTRETFVWKDGMDGWKPLAEVGELAHLLSKAPLSPGPPSMPAQAKAQAPVPRFGATSAPAPVVSRATGKLSGVPKPSIPKPTLPKPSLPPKVGERDAVVTSDPLIKEGVDPIPSLAAPGGDADPNTVPVPSLRVAESSSEERVVAEGKPQESSDVAPSPQRPGEGDFALPEKVNSPGTTDAQDKEAKSHAEAPTPDIAMPGEGPYVANQEPSYESLIMRLQKKRHNPYAIPLAVVGALVLGITLGFVFFGDQKTKIVRQVVEVPAEAGEEANQHEDVAEENVAAGQAREEDPEEQPTQQKAEVSSSKQAGSSSNSDAPGSPTSTEISEGLKGLSGLEGLKGPSAGPAGPSSSSGSGRPLDSSQIQSTVSKYRTSVKRGCWQPALDSRDKDAPSSARVSVAITVASSGSVTNATTSGDPKGYRGLASCISSKVRGWRFPPSSGTTTVNVPFVFAAQ